VFCAVFGYIELARSGYSDLFIAASVFIAPALLASVLSVAVKGRLMIRRLRHRQAVANGADAAIVARARSRSTQMRIALRMLAQRFVLAHDERAYEERKSANDLERYEGYTYMLGIATEAWLPTLGSDACYPP
jgi:hypothetical protein